MTDIPDDFGEFHFEFLERLEVKVTQQLRAQHVG